MNYVVGELYRPGIKKWKEFVEYLFTDQGHELRIFLALPTEAHCRSVSEGDWRFAFYQSGPALFFLYTAPFLEWSDAPFSWHLVPEKHRTLPSSLDQIAELRIHLVDATTGMLVARRACSLSPHFTGLWHAAVRRQAERDFDRAEYDFAVVKAQCSLEPKQMVRAAMATTRGGGLVLSGPGFVGLS